MIKIIVDHIAKREPTLTANAFLKTTTEKEVYGFSVEELRKEMEAQDKYHLMVGPFKNNNPITQNEFDSNLHEEFVVDDNEVPGITIENCWWVMRESKLEEAIRYGGAKFRLFQRQYLRDNYDTSWYAWKE
jgi:predicted HAD superfamily hydrolase